MRKSCISILHSLLHRALLKPYLLDLAKDLSGKCCLVLISLLASCLWAYVSIISNQRFRVKLKYVKLILTQPFFPGKLSSWQDPNRINIEKGFYHILTRGNHRQDIFLTDTDRKRFLEYLEKYAAIFNYKLHCYCLMYNHISISFLRQMRQISLKSCRDS